MRETIRRSKLTQEAFAARLGISPRSLTRYLTGTPLPAVVLTALEGIMLLQGVGELIDGLPSGTHVPVTQLRALSPALAKPVPIKKAKPVRKPRKVKIRAVKPKLPGRKGRGFGAPRIYHIEPDANAGMMRILHALRPRTDPAVSQTLEQQLRAAFATPQTAEADDDQPPRGPGFVTRLL